MKLYLKYYFSFLVIISLILSIPISYLYIVGEYLTLHEVAQKQIISTNNKIIYGSALHGDTFNYKRHLVNLVRPDIVALGSSRVMQFREYMFSTSALSLGGAMNSIIEGNEFVSSILIPVKAKVVIIGADIWWFNDCFQNPKKIESHNSNDSSNASPKIRDAWTVTKWLFDEKITIKKIAKVFFEKNSDDIGVAGQEKDGFGPDGSYYYTRLITGQKVHEDKKFNNTYTRIKNGNSRFQYASLANNQHIENFIKLVDKLEKSGIHTIVFFPPFASAVNSRMNSLNGKYDYIDDIKNKLRKYKLKYYDYTDATAIGSGDCEFIDGFHGGEITYMRILKDISQYDPVLYKNINYKLINELIEENEGRAFVFDNEITTNNEVDFLELGCKK